MKKLFAVAVAFICGLVQAEDFYWSGKGGDGRWDTVANWAIDAALTKPASRCPASGLKVYFILDTFENHEVSVIVPDGAACSTVFVKDTVAPGKLTLVGEPAEGATRATLTQGVFNTNFAGTYGVVITCQNLNMPNGRPLTQQAALDGAGFVLDNCACNINGNSMLVPTGANCSFVIRDSEIRNTQGLSRTSAGGDNLTVSISNTTFSCTAGAGFTLYGSKNLQITIEDCDITINGQAKFGNAQATDTGYRLKISNTTICQNGQSNFRFVSDGGVCELDHVRFTTGPDYVASGATKVASWKSPAFVGEGIVVRMTHSDLLCYDALTTAGTIYLDDSRLIVTNAASTSISGGYAHYVLSGKRTQFFPGQRFNTSTAQATFDFVVPEGGYDHPPLGVDGVLAKFNNNFFSLAGGAINVLPSSPAARVGTTAVYPLIYVYTGSTGKQLNLQVATPSGLPNEASSFLVSSVSNLPYEDVNSQDEEWWNPVDLSNGYSAGAQAALAVKIVGRDTRPPTVTDLAYVGPVGDNVTFALDLANLGELPAGDPATTVTPTLIYRLAGSDSWTEVEQDDITATGVTTLTAPKTGFTDGDYEIGVRLVNDIEGSLDYILPETVEIAFSKATLSNLGYVGEGIFATITGTVTGTGAASKLAAVLEVSEAEDFSAGVATYPLGDFAAGESFEKTVEINPGVATYYRVTVGEGSGTAQATVSGVSRTVATLGEFTAVNTNGLCRVVVDGTLTARGAGDSTVKLRYSMDGVNWLTNTVGTVSVDGTAFTGECVYPMPEGTAYYEILVENTSGDHTWVAEGGVQSIAVKDRSTYYWRAVEGEWSGNWNDGRHWYKPDLPNDVTLYPCAAEAKASFRECPAAEAATVVTLTSDISVSRIESTTAGQKLTFTGATNVTLATLLQLYQSNGYNTFEGLALVVNSGDTQVPLTTADVTYELSQGARMTLNNHSAKGSTTMIIGEDCLLTVKGKGQEGGRSTFLVNNGRMNYAGFVGQNSGAGSVSFRLSGKKARVAFTGDGTYLNASWKNVRFIFEIPDGGYDEIPVQLTKGTGSFLYFSNNNGVIASAFCKPGDDNGLIYAIADNSPALLAGQGRKIEQDLFLWNKTGFAYDHDNADEAQRYDLLDYTKLQVPETTSAGRKVKNFSVMMRGLDEQEYATPGEVKAAGTTAYAVGYRIARESGFVLILR